MTEPVQGAGGVYPPQDGYLAVAAQAVRPARRLPDLRRGHHRVRPPRHLVRRPSLRRAHPTSSRSPRASPPATIPLGGVFVGPAPTAALETDPEFFLRHGFTYSGHPTACAAGVEEPGDHPPRRPGRAGQAHRGPARRRPAGTRTPMAWSSRVRGIGGMWALVLRPDQDAKAIRDHMLDKSNVIVRALGDGLCVLPAAGDPRRAHRSDGRCSRRGSCMKFGIFYEHQIGRPWDDGTEHRLIQDALDQVELADSLGIQYVWEVEHHFLEEYSHSSAPEVFLAACSQRTTNMRLGHGIILTAPQFNHPARTAERVSMLDLVSNGRVEFGSGESSSEAELAGFGVDPLREARRVAGGARGGRAMHGRDAVHRRRRQVRADAAAQRRSRSRCRSRTRRCGWRAAGATRSCSPPRRAWAR